MMVAVMMKLSHLSGSEITWTSNVVSNFPLCRLLFLFPVSQNEIGELEITIAGCFGMSVDNRATGLLRVLAQQLFVDPETKRMIVCRSQNGALRPRLGTFAGIFTPEWVSGAYNGAAGYG